VSLFHYKVSLTDGKVKEGKTTAKDEAAARIRLEKELSIAKWHSIRVEPTPKTTSNSKPTPKPKAVSAQKPLAETKPPTEKQKSLTKLQKMLYLQLGRCFFCGELLTASEASIEHLNPKAKGGTSTDDNEVVCHATLNHTFGSMGLKQKFEFVLKNAGSFTCPGEKSD
jgi:hypothetical protein